VELVLLGVAFKCASGAPLEAPGILTKADPFLRVSW